MGFNHQHEKEPISKSTKQRHTSNNNNNNRLCKLPDKDVNN